MRAERRLAGGGAAERPKRDPLALDAAARFRLGADWANSNLDAPPAYK